jgi:hypothetical protein
VAEQMLTGTPFVALWGIQADYVYGTASDGVRLEVIDEAENVLLTASPVIDEAVGERGSVLVRTYLGRRGLGLPGPVNRLPAPVGVLAYRGLDTPTTDPQGRAIFELTVDVQRTGSVFDESNPALIAASVANVETGYVSPVQQLSPETDRAISLSVPVEAVEGGDFDLRIQTLTRDVIVSVSGERVRVVTGGKPFAANLALALLGQWLLSLLVAACGLAFSTVVSWPIALVLTLGVLGGRWVGDQLGEDVGTGFGTDLVQTVGADADAATQEVIERTGAAVGGTFATLSRVLPSIAPFDATGEVAQGTSVPIAQLVVAAGIMSAVALPLLVGAYVILRNREVQP